MHTTARSWWLLLLILCYSRRVTSFLPSQYSRNSRAAALVASNTALQGGYGVATSYSWSEEPFEVDVRVKVPPDTRAKDIVFRATPRSIDLRIDGREEPLLDGSRNMRGRISLDGTFWVISDDEEDSSQRVVTVTIEKSVKTPKDDFEIIEYDWGGVYPNDEEEVEERKYEEPEELNIREYAASLGVDIDNIDMSMVDKTMFTSGLNLTKSTMDEISKAGYVQEVTQQSDGTEYITNEEGDVVPFDALGDTIASDEIRQTSRIPFLDTNSPWNTAVPVDDLHEDGPNNVAKELAARPESHEMSASDSESEALDKDADAPDPKAADPIDMLTVKRLKDILRTQGLKVSGSKPELQDRLRGHVQSIIQDKRGKDGESVSEASQQ
jgi:hypothetical protein